MHVQVIRYAGECGYHALVVTVDTPVPGNREQTYNDPQWSLGMQTQVGGFPPIHSTDEAGVNDNLPGGVSRHDIADIWVALFSRWQRYRCEQHCAALTWEDLR